MLGFAGGRHPPATHICLLFDDSNERDKVLLPYFSAGLRAGHYVEYFVDVDDAAALEERRNALPLPAPDGKIVASIATQKYFPEGTFHPEDMLLKFGEVHETARLGGYAGAGIVGEPSWALRGYPGSERLAEFEASINDLLATVPMTVICAYDTRRFSGDLLADIVAVHPVTVMGQRWIVNDSPARAEQIRKMRRIA